MNSITNTLVGTITAGALALTSAVPAVARDRHDGHDGISAGEIIAGAVILGGIAAIASAASTDRGYNRTYNDASRYDNRRNRGGYNDYYGRGNPRAAVEQCVRAAERNAMRSGYRYANVTEIGKVDDTRYGWRVRGRIEVQTTRGYGDRYDRYSRGRHSDSGRFACDFSRGQVVDLDYSGVRGLR